MLIDLRRGAGSIASRINSHPTFLVFFIDNSAINLNVAHLHSPSAIVTLVTKDFIDLRSAGFSDLGVDLTYSEVDLKLLHFIVRELVDLAFDVSLLH